MKKTILLLCLSIIFLARAQEINLTQTDPYFRTNLTCDPTPSIPYNTVLNGGFEQFSDLPTGATQIDRACGWFTATSKTPDYFHRDGANNVSIPNNYIGSQEVNPIYGGDAYVGLSHSGSNKEMIRTQLAQPLLSETEYILQFDVSAKEIEGLGLNFIKIQAYLGGLIESTINSGDLNIESDPSDLFFVNDEYTTNTLGWDTIEFTFTTGDTAGQEYLYIGGLNGIDNMNDFGVAYSLIDNIILIPNCNNNTIPLQGDITIDPGTYMCSDFPITITGAYEHPQNLNGSFTSFQNITLEILQDGNPIITSIPVTVTTTSTGIGTGNYSANITADNLNTPIEGEYTFKVNANFIFSESCGMDTGIFLETISTQSNDDGPIINVDFFCCNDGQGFSVIPTCQGLGCDPCDTPDGLVNFIVRDPSNVTVDSDSYPGMEFSWSIENIETGTFSSFEAPVDTTVSVTLTLNGECVSNPIEGIQDCNEPPSCEDCSSLAQEILDSYDNTTICVGQITVPEGTNDCYNIFILNNQTLELTELFDGTTQTQHIIPQFGSYQIIINENKQNTFVCGVEDIFSGVICRNTRDKKNIKVYPNPFSDQFTIESQSLSTSIKQIEVYNTYGLRIKFQNYQIGNSIRIDRGAPGVYFAKIYFDDGTIETLQLIKK